MSVYDNLDRIEALAEEVQRWLADNEQGAFAISCQRCGAPFEHEGYAVAAPLEWYGALEWEAELARVVLTLVEIARAAQALRKQVGHYKASDGSQVSRVVGVSAFVDLDAALARLNTKEEA